MKQYVIPITWMRSGKIRVQAESFEKALEEAESVVDTYDTNTLVDSALEVDEVPGSVELEEPDTIASINAHKLTTEEKDEYGV